MSDALYIYSKRYVITSCIWNHLVYMWKCYVQKLRMSLCVIHRYYNRVDMPIVLIYIFNIYSEPYLLLAFNIICVTWNMKILILYST